MIFNFCIFVFILCMAFAWSTWGSFSALLHLLCVVVSGTLAFALWETVALKFVLKIMPAQGWCVSLLGVYVGLLFSLGIITRIAVPAKIAMHRVADAAFGGIFGVIASILTSGIVVISLGFLPLGVDLFGYQPLGLDPMGKVIKTHSSSIFCSVDSIALGFFEYLSWGPFSSYYPMTIYQPELNTQAALYRLKIDPFSSPAIVPGSVNLHRWFYTKLWPAVLDERATQKLGDRKANEQLVIIDTEWKNIPGTYDPDGALRVHPSQVWLLIKHVTKEGYETEEMIAPISASVGDPTTPSRQFYVLNDDKTVLAGNSPTMFMGWTFLLPPDTKPYAALIRKTRYELDDKPLGESPEMAEAFGKLTADATKTLTATAAPETTSNIGPRVGMAANAAGVAIDVTDMMPRPLSKNSAVGLYFDGSAVRSGRGDFPAATPGSPLSVLADKMWCPPHMVMVRVQITKDQAQSMFGAFRASAASLQPLQLVDVGNQAWQPTGYAMVRDNGDLKVYLEPDSPIQTVKELPVDQIGPNSQLFVYFPVKRGTKLKSLQIGNTTSQALTIDVPQ